MRLKSNSPDGLLFFIGEYDVSPSSDYLAIGLVNGQPQLTFDLGDGESTVVFDRARLDDGLWHKIRALREGSTALLEVDGVKATEKTSRGQLKQLQTDGTISIGGLSDVFRRTRGRYADGLRGCISNVTLSEGYDVDLLGQADITSNIKECDETAAAAAAPGA